MPKVTISIEEKIWIEECYAFMDSLNADSCGKTWDRNDLYDLDGQIIRGVRISNPVGKA